MFLYMFLLLYTCGFVYLCFLCVVITGLSPFLCVFFCLFFCPLTLCSLWQQIVVITSVLQTTCFPAYYLLDNTLSGLLYVTWGRGKLGRFLSVKRKNYTHYLKAFLNIGEKTHKLTGFRTHLLNII